MKYRTLGSTGLRVSVVGVGTWQFGGEWGRELAQEEVTAILRRAAELGINLIDTAECYGDHTSEAFIGQALADLGGRRPDWIIATKFGHRFHRPFERTEPREPADVRRQLEDSLRALKTDYVDLYQYHSWGDGDFFRDDVLAELAKLKGEGKFRHLGNSVGKITNTAQVGASSARGIGAIQIVYNRLQRESEQATLPICIQQKMGVMARVPLASGYLSGKYRPGHQFDAGEVRGHWHKPEQREAWLREAEQIKRNEYAREVDSARTTMATWALAWCLRHPAVTCVIAGVKDAAQVESNAAAAELLRDQTP